MGKLTKAQQVALESMAKGYTLRHSQDYGIIYKAGNEMALRIQLKVKRR